MDDMDDMDDYFMTYMKRYKNNFQIVGSPSAVFMMKNIFQVTVILN